MLSSARSGSCSVCKCCFAEEVWEMSALHCVCCGALHRELNMGLLAAAWLLHGERIRVIPCDTSRLLWFCGDAAHHLE